MWSTNAAATTRVVVASTESRSSVGARTAAHIPSRDGFSAASGSGREQSSAGKAITAPVKGRESKSGSEGDVGAFGGGVIVGMSRFMPGGGSNAISAHAKDNST